VVIVAIIEFADSADAPPRSRRPARPPGGAQGTPTTESRSGWPCTITTVHRLLPAGQHDRLLEPGVQASGGPGGVALAPDAPIPGAEADIDGINFKWTAWQGSGGGRLNLTIFTIRLNSFSLPLRRADGSAQHQQLLGSVRNDRRLLNNADSHRVPRLRQDLIASRILPHGSRNTIAYYEGPGLHDPRVMKYQTKWRDEPRP